MHLGGLLSTQEARVALGYRVPSNLPRASISPWLHAARLPFLNPRSDRFRPRDFYGFDRFEILHFLSFLR